MPSLRLMAHAHSTLPKAAARVRGAYTHRVHGRACWWAARSAAHAARASAVPPPAAAAGALATGGAAGTCATGTGGGVGAVPGWADGPAAADGIGTPCSTLPACASPAAAATASGLSPALWMITVVVAVALTLRLQQQHQQHTKTAAHRRGGREGRGRRGRGGGLTAAERRTPARAHLQVDPAPGWHCSPIKRRGTQGAAHGVTHTRPRPGARRSRWQSKPTGRSSHQRWRSSAAAPGCAPCARGGGGGWLGGWGVVRPAQDAGQSAHPPGGPERRASSPLTLAPGALPPRQPPGPAPASLGQQPSCHASQGLCAAKPSSAGGVGGRGHAKRGPVERSAVKAPPAPPPSPCASCGWCGGAGEGRRLVLEVAHAPAASLSCAACRAGVAPRARPCSSAGR